MAGRWPVVSRTAIAVFCALMICALAPDLRAAGERVRTRVLDAKELAGVQSKVDAIPVPGRAGPLQIDRSQAFALQGDGFEAFWLLPARYEANDQTAGYTSPRCGVFLLRPNGKSQFLKTIGYDWTGALRCNNLSGVGFVAGKSGEPPRILLSYSSSSPNYPVQEPVVLDWSTSDAQYFDNEKLSRRLEDDDKVSNVLSMKRQLNSY